MLLGTLTGLSLDFLLIILHPVLVEVLVRGVALLVVEDLPAGLPCLALVLKALLDVVSLEDAEEKDWILSFLVTFTILTISTSSLSVESEEDPSSELDDSIVITSGIRSEFLEAKGPLCCSQPQLWMFPISTRKKCSIFRKKGKLLILVLS